MMSVLRQLPRNNRIMIAVERGNNDYADHSADSGAHEQGLVGDWFYLERGRQRGGNLRQHAAHLLDDIERRGAANFQDAQQRAALSVAADDVGFSDRGKPSQACTLHRAT